MQTLKVVAIAAFGRWRLLERFLCMFDDRVAVDRRYGPAQDGLEVIRRDADADALVLADEETLETAD